MSVSEYEVNRLISDMNNSDNWEDTGLVDSVGSVLRRALITYVENIYKSKLIIAYNVNLEKDIDEKIKSCIVFIVQSTANEKISYIYDIIEKLNDLMFKEAPGGKPNLIYIFGDHELQKNYIKRSMEMHYLSDDTGFYSLMRMENPRNWIISTLKPLLSKSSICPFNHVGPCPPEMFVGRYNLIRKILGGKHVAHAISGGRRIGKSSLLSKIMFDVTKGEFHPAQYQPLYIDCSYFGTYQDLTDHITRKLFPQIFHRRVYHESDSGSNKDFSMVKTDLEYIVSRTHLKNKTLLLLLDEMDPLIDRAKQRSKDSLFFYSFIRALANSGKIKFIISGFRSVSEMIADFHHPFYNLCIGTHLEPLTEDEAYLLVTLPFLKNEISVINEKRIVKRIFDATAGHPSVIQFIAGHLFTNRQNNTIAENDLNNAFRDKELINFVRENFLMNTNALERLLCLYSLYADEITLEFAVSSFRTDGIHIKNMDKVVSDAMRNLQHNNIFSQEEDLFSFFFPMMKSILKRYYDSPEIRNSLKSEILNGR